MSISFRIYLILVIKKSFRDQTVDVVAKQVKTCGGWGMVTSAGS
jgi:hypothetical protein